MNIGDEFVVEVTAIAHGGHCVARHDGRVIFVRHTIPGERVRVKITELSKNFARADCIEVLTASPDRVDPKCRYARPGGCGGCDFQHVSLSAQRRLKAEIIKEQFARLAKMDIDVKVELVEPTESWRTRMEFTVSPNRKIAMYRARKNELIEIESCEIASEAIQIQDLNSKRLPEGKKVDVAVSSEGEVVVSIEGRENLALVEQKVMGFEFKINPESFWQSHSKAPEVLTETVISFAKVQQGEHVFDLYSGVGLFSSALISLVGVGGRITMIEESGSAVTDARRTFAPYENVEIVEGRVERELKKYVRGDVVVIDPPRAGAGERVIRQIHELEPHTIVYVACDPAALARDTAILRTLGYELDALRAFDLFPMTQHIESVARFIRKG